MPALQPQAPTPFALCASIWAIVFAESSDGAPRIGLKIRQPSITVELHDARAITAQHAINLFMSRIGFLLLLTFDLEEGAILALLALLAAVDTNGDEERKDGPSLPGDGLGDARQPSAELGERDHAATPSGRSSASARTRALWLAKAR